MHQNQLRFSISWPGTRLGLVSLSFAQGHTYFDSPVHTPDTGHNVHWQDDRSEHSKLAKNIRRLLLTFVHPDVDLGKVVAVSTREETEELISLWSIVVQGLTYFS